MRDRANYDFEFISFLINKGYDATYIGMILDVPPQNLLPMIRKRGLKLIKQRTLKLTPYQVQQAVNEYKSGISTIKLAYKFDVDNETISRILKTEGVEIREGNAKIYKHSNFNHEAFSDFTDERAAYFYGLILADGCLSKNKSGDYNCVSIGLKSTDSYILQNLLDYIGSDNKVRSYERYDNRTCKTYNVSSVSFNDVKVTSRLVEQGLSARKSANEVLPKDTLVNSRHFWRGLVDGDGCLRIKGNHFLLNLVGSYAVTKGLVDYAKSNFVLKTERTPYDRKNLFSITFTGSDARKLAKLLYCESNIHLTRKYDKASTCFNKGTIT